MTSAKHRNRARHRVEKLLDEAWEALGAGHTLLADKLSLRAVEQGHVNPRVWNDRGLIALRCGRPDEADAAFRRAIAIAPTYADAFANLAALQAERGKLAPALRLQRRAVELAPQRAELSRRLAELEGLAPERTAPDQRTPADDDPGTATDRDPDRSQRSPRTEHYDAKALERELVARGLARLPALLSPREVADLLGLAPEHFEHDVEIDDPVAGCATTRAFRAPLPESIARLRDDGFALAIRVAAALDAHLPGPRRETPCAAPLRGNRPGVRIARLAPDGELRLPAPAHGFGLGLALALGPGDAVTTIALTDLRPGRRVRRGEVRAAPGDGVLYCLRERLVRVGGVFGLQRAAASIGPGDAARTVLDVRFEDDG